MRSEVTEREINIFLYTHHIYVCISVGRLGREYGYSIVYVIVEEVEAG